MTKASDDSADDATSDFWLWADVFLAGAFIVMLVDRAIEREWIWGSLAAVLVVWQGRKAVGAVRELSARRRRPS
ncbi:MAG: hypothetical protein L0K86_15860 [Actinomycetia bacterium]|nr:hypothetical protein [Actinomycetes bacterium]